MWLLSPVFTFPFVFLFLLFVVVFADVPEIVGLLLLSTLSDPGVLVPGVSVPGLSVPGLSVPGLSGSGLSGSGLSGSGLSVPGLSGVGFSDPSVIFHSCVPQNGLAIPRKSPLSVGINARPP